MRKKIILFAGTPAGFFSLDKLFREIFMIHRILYTLTFLALLSCNNQSDSEDSAVAKAARPNNTFATCFSDCDTSKIGETIGCSGRVYKRVNDKYVICLRPAFPVQLDSCYAVTIDSSNAEKLTEIFVFDNEDANLANNCTDITFTDNPMPTRQFYAQSGKLVIGYSDPTELHGNITYHTTILVKQLIFIDSKTGEKIELTNELCWKVLDTGTPG